MKPIQTSLFGPSHDQNTFGSMQWGLLDFFPASTPRWTDTCRHCLLHVRNVAEQRPDDDCCFAPCNADERNDGRVGYYSIHQMPEV